MDILDSPILYAFIALIVAVFGPNLGAQLPEYITEFSTSVYGRLLIGLIIVILTQIDIRLGFITLCLLMIIYLTASNADVARMEMQYLN